MRRTADRKHLQPGKKALPLMLFEHFTQSSNLDDLRSELEDLEIKNKLTDAEGLAVRACIEIADRHLDDAEALLEGAGSCARKAREKSLVLHVRALLAMQRGSKKRALRLVLQSVWLCTDPRMWVLFLIIADRTRRADIVEATLRALVEAEFFEDEELRRTLASDPRLQNIRSCEIYRSILAPRLARSASN
jgi:hypothetical protein